MKTRRYEWIVRGLALATAAFGAMSATTTARTAVATDAFALVSAKGVATIAGKVGGQAVNCSTTLYPVYDEDENSMTFYGRVPTTVNKRPALVWINLGFWPDGSGKHELSEFMGTVYLR